MLRVDRGRGEGSSPDCSALLTLKVVDTRALAAILKTAGAAVHHEPAGLKRNHLARVRFPPVLERGA